MKNSFKELTFAELVAKRQELIRKEQQISFDTVLGHVQNRLEKRTIRRQIAKLNTMIYAHDDVK